MSVLYNVYYLLLLKIDYNVIKLTLRARRNSSKSITPLPSLSKAKNISCNSYKKTCVVLTM